MNSHALKTYDIQFRNKTQAAVNAQDVIVHDGVITFVDGKGTSSRWTVAIFSMIDVLSVRLVEE